MSEVANTLMPFEVLFVLLRKTSGVTSGPTRNLAPSLRASSVFLLVSLHNLNFPM